MVMPSQTPLSDDTGSGDAALTPTRMVTAPVQPTKTNGGKSNLKSKCNCLKVVDTFRQRLRHIPINKYSDYFSDNIKALLLLTALPKLEGQCCVSAAISCPLQKVFYVKISKRHKRPGG